MGGDIAWSDEVTAIQHGAWQIITTIAAAAGAKKSQLPKPPKPPEPGWQDKARARQQHATTKMTRWLARHPELTTSQ
ncbi:hypothetical protein CWT12_06430 [Actinomyces sp. 432]|uniref:hypothetical protein n=1 Tax=Actinomyces sp. 432 TaxID=2057798 RepID=UPI0013742352|nr:hypothetical protein [Actinomyces sp. 432]QHO91024.1 hypothetical protein CWT12_06430 [Actinomyces sp. 432]